MGVSSGGRGKVVPPGGSASGHRWAGGICVEKVSFGYGDELVIHNAHFHIDRGSLVSFIGPNGGGKTTLVKLILGLLEPESGYITVFGKTPKEARSSIGYVPQSTLFDPDFPIIVMDVVLMGRLKRGLAFLNRRDRVLAAEALDLVGLLDLAKRPYSALSGGQRQRVLIARALVTRPEALILDEPTSHVDMASQGELHRLLLELKGDTTIILVSHDLNFVGERVKKVICIDREVAIHPAGKLNEASYRRIFSRPLQVVQHNTLLEEEHD